MCKIKCTHFFSRWKRWVGRSMNNSIYSSSMKLSRYETKKKMVAIKNVSVNFIITCVHCQRVNKVSCSFLYFFFCPPFPQLPPKWEWAEKRATVTNKNFIIDQKKCNGFFFRNLPLRESRPLYDNKCKRPQKLL